MGKSLDEEFDAAPSLDDEFDAAPSVKPPPGPPQEPGFLDPRSVSGARLRGFGQGASLGLLDELAGAGLAGWAGSADLVSRLAGAMPEERAELRYRLTGAKPEESAYQRVRDDMRRENHQAQAENPGNYAAAQFLGGLAAPVPGAPARLKDATVLSRALQMGGYGAKLGAASALGNAEGDLPGQLAGTAVGAGLGGAVGAAAGPIEYGIVNKLQPWLRQKAAEQARKAVTPSASMTNYMYNQGITTPEKELEFGKQVLDSGALKMFGTTRDTYERALQNQQGLGGQIGDFTREAQQLVDQGVASPASRSEVALATQEALRKAGTTDARRAALPGVEKRLLPAAGKETGGPDAFELAMSSLTGTTAPGQRAPFSFPEMWQNKSQLQDALKPNELSSLGQQLYNEGVAGYTRNVYDQLERTLGPSKVDDLREVAAKYGANEQIINMLGRAWSREANRHAVGIMDAMHGGLAGQATGVPGLGVAAAIGSAFARPRWNSTAALTSQALGNGRLPVNGVMGGVPTRMAAQELGGAAGAAANKSNAYEELMRRFGIAPEDDAGLADEAYLRQQSDPSMQKGAR